LLLLSIAAIAVIDKLTIGEGRGDKKILLKGIGNWN